MLKVDSPKVKTPSCPQRNQVRNPPKRSKRYVHFDNASLLKRRISHCTLFLRRPSHPKTFWALGLKKQRRLVRHAKRHSWDSVAAAERTKRAIPVQVFLWIKWFDSNTKRVLLRQSRHHAACKICFKRIIRIVHLPLTL